MSTPARVLQFPTLWRPETPSLPVLRLPMAAGSPPLGGRVLTMDALAQRRFRLLLFDPICQSASGTVWEQTDQWLKAALPYWGAALVIATGPADYPPQADPSSKIILE